MDPAWFELYKKTVEHYLEESFLYQLSEKNGIMYDSEKISRWEETNKEKS